MAGDPNSVPAIVWFRDDLRIADNPALAAAARGGRPVVCVYIFDEESPGLRPLGGASRWWLARSLRALAHDLNRLGGNLVLRRGAAGKIVPALARDVDARAVYWNRRYGSAAAIDAAIAADLIRTGVKVETHQASLLYEPDRVAGRGGQPMRVFTPFWRAARQSGEPRMPLSALKSLNGVRGLASDDVADWALEPAKPDWAGGLRGTWTPGEAGARARLEKFLAEGLSGYATLRDRPDLDRTSRLSPHLRFGEISPFQVWHAAQHAADSGKARASDVEKFLSELGWREFSYHLLHRHPELATRNLQPRFDAFPWTDDRAALAAWRRGRTGYPLVDAGMRELWRTGYMHNRVRMVVASFLVKHLLIDWRRGEQWFWDTLVDADPANNPASWQWVAGSGADAAPYFRILNPVLQSETFDPDGTYLRRHVPELAQCPAEIIHQPWKAPPGEQAKLGGYPSPIVDLRAGRERALAAFAETKG